MVQICTKRLKSTENDCKPGLIENRWNTGLTKFYEEQYETHNETNFFAKNSRIRNFSDAFKIGDFLFLLISSWKHKNMEKPWNKCRLIFWELFFGIVFFWKYPYGESPYGYLNFQNCSDLAQIFLNDVFLITEFIFDVKSNYRNLQRLSDKPCEKNVEFWKSA